MNSFNTVLVPTDGSDHARRAAEHAATLATAFGASINVVTVVDMHVDAGPFNVGGLTEEDKARLREDALRTIDRTVEVIDGPEEIRTELIEGVPVDDIVEYSESKDIDLIAMGTAGRTGLGRYIAGSVAEGVVRRADVPVLTVRTTDWSQGAAPYEDVLIPTDGSEYASAAVEPAIAIADAFDARVHAIHVVDVRNVAAGGGYNLPTEILDNLRSRGEQAVDDVATRARDVGLEVTTTVLEGIPPAGILDYAEDHDVDVIAMGTAGRTGLNRFLLGSTAERVIRHAEMPVLAVNARDSDAE